MSDKNLLNRLVEAAGDTDVVFVVQGNQRSEAKARKAEPEELTMKVKIQDNGHLAFDITSDISPELLAYIFVRIAVIADGDHLIKILEDNGYTDVKYRIQKGSNEAISALMNEMTRPDVQPEPKPELKAEPAVEPTKASNSEKMKSQVEAAIIQAIQQAEAQGVTVTEVKLVDVPAQKPEGESKPEDDDRPFINALH